MCASPRDANGNLTDDGVQAYAWDAEGRLTKVTDNSGGGTTTGYVYNALGQIVELTPSVGQLEEIYDPEGQRVGYYSR